MRSVKELKGIKAIRGEKLVISLGRVYDGTLTSWMSRNKNKQSYRSFAIGSNKDEIIMSSNKMKDYIDQDGNIIEDVAGRWYFDVKFIPTGKTVDDEYTVVRGYIDVAENVTGSAETQGTIESYTL